MSWRPLPPSPLDKRLGATVVAAGDAIVVWGGLQAGVVIGAAGAAIDVDEQVWSPLPDCPLAPRSGCQAVVTTQGIVFFGGGSRPDRLAEAAIFDLDAWSWHLLPSCPSGGRVGHSLFAVGDVVYCWSGRDSREWPRTDLPLGIRLDLASLEWSIWDPGPLRLRETVGLFTGRELVAWGGRDAEGGGYRADGAAFDVERQAWRRLSEAPLSPRQRFAHCWTGEELYVVGGYTNGPTVRSREFPDGIQTSKVVRDGAVYRPDEDSWRTITSSPVPLSTDAALWRGAPVGDLVLFTGPDGTLLYDPVHDTWERTSQRYGVAGPIVTVGDRVYGYTAGAQVWGEADLVVWEPEPTGAVSIPKPEPSVALADDILERLYATTGAMRFELRDLTDVAAAEAAMREARRRVLAIRHPEEPDEPFASWASNVETVDGSVAFTVDMADAEAYDGVIEAALDAVVGALTDAGISEGTLTTG